MIHIYYILLVLTAVLSSIVTLYIPNIIARYRQYKTTKHEAKHKALVTTIQTEIENYLKQIIK